VLEVDKHGQLTPVPKGATARDKRLTVRWPFVIAVAVVMVIGYVVVK
jgi:hypothetical protein